MAWYAGGRFSDPFQKWFGRFLAKAGATAPRTSYHSFRDALREAQASDEIVDALLGWTRRTIWETSRSGPRITALWPRRSLGSDTPASISATSISGEAVIGSARLSLDRAVLSIVSGCSGVPPARCRSSTSKELPAGIRKGSRLMSKRASIIERLRKHPGRGQTAAEIAQALGLRDGRSVALQLKWLERQGVVRVTRFAGTKNMSPGYRGQWFLPTSERAYALVSMPHGRGR